MTESEIEAVARAICASRDLIWAEITARIRAVLREDARAAIRALDDCRAAKRRTCEMGSLDIALWIAGRVHAGMTDKGGQPYIWHVTKVANAQTSGDAMIVAYLHDVVEDGAPKWTLDRLRGWGFSEEIVTAVDCLTRRKGETYDAFIDRCAGNELARAVKIADLTDNMDLDRLRREPTAADHARVEKYRKALAALTSATMTEV